MTKDECITLLKKYTGILKEKYGITSLSLFGSTARGEQKEGSDIDLFVDTETPNPFLLMDAKGFLEDATGSSVDIIRNHQNLNPRLRKRILRMESLSSESKSIALDILEDILSAIERLESIATHQPV